MNDACIGKIELDKRSSYSYSNDEDTKNKMLTLPEYLHQAEAIIKRFAPKGDITHILSNEDAVSYVAYWLMLADWRYEKGHGTIQSSYRVNTGRFAIKRYLNRRFVLSGKNSKKKYFSECILYPMGVKLFLRWESRYRNIEHIAQQVHQKTKTPYENVSNAEFMKSILEMLKDPSLTPRESLSIRRVYLEGYTQEETSKQIGVSKSCIGLYIKNGITKLRERSEKYITLFESLKR